MNDAASKTFNLSKTASFDEVGIATQSRFFCVWQYNKDKSDKFHIELFVMADRTHEFVIHIDVYEVNNAVNIDIYARAANPLTTIKSVVNGIIAAGVGNDTDSARKLFWIIFMHTQSYWPPWRRISMCLQAAHVGITVNAHH